jgi:hypothetical protein
VYNVIDTGRGSLIVAVDYSSPYAEQVTKRQWNRSYLEELAAGLNHNALSPLYTESLRVLGRYEYVI